MISSTDTAADYYRILGISSGATPEDVKAAYRAKLRLWHPDLVANKTGDAWRAATEMTAQLNEAYECLSDPDLRAAYDTSRRAGTASTRRPSASRLVVSPRTLRCEVTPSDIVRVSVDVRADHPPGGEGPTVRTSDQLGSPTFTTTARTANSARVTVRADTSRLAAHRIYHIPIVVMWGKMKGTATLVVRTTGLRDSDSTSQFRREPSPSSRRNRMRRPDRRGRDLIAISMGGIVLPLLLLAWASDLLPAQAPPNPLLVAAICSGVIVATTWLLTSSRLLRQPDRLAPMGVAWSHLTRWSGWILVGGCAVFLGIPAVVLLLMVVIATPILGFVAIAFISGRFDSRKR